VTSVSAVPLDETGLAELAVKRKLRCGIGGAVKDAWIETQGDVRDHLMAELESMGHR
jgi:translation initiation factor 1